MDKSSNFKGKVQRITNLVIYHIFEWTLSMGTVSVLFTILMLDMMGFYLIDYIRDNTTLIYAAWYLLSKLTRLFQTIKCKRKSIVLRDRLMVILFLISILPKEEFFPYVGHNSVKRSITDCNCILHSFDE